MAKSETVGELAKALAQAQGKIRGALKDSANPFFKTKYADLSSVVEAIREPLSEHGIAYVQLTEPSDKDEVRVETMLLHASGEWISSVLALPVTKADAQGYGSALTYARRYGLAAACGVAPEDDDGNAAVGGAKKDRVPQAPEAPTPTETEPLEDRNTLLGHISGAASKKKLSPEVRRELWALHCGEATPDTADLAALTDLLRAIRAR